MGFVNDCLRGLIWYQVIYERPYAPIIASYIRQCSVLDRLSLSGPTSVRPPVVGAGSPVYDHIDNRRKS